MSGTETVVVACCQLAPRIGEVAANRAAAAAAIEAAAAGGAQVVVLPELCASGYVFEDAGEARSLAEPVDGPTVTGWRSLARRLGVVVVGGVCEVDGDGLLRNSAVVVDADGTLRAVYRKAHLWDREDVAFTAGAEPPPVVQTRFGRLGVMVCYDLEFPEWVRLAALGGAELLCAPANWPAAARLDGERAGEVVRTQADASVNRIFVAVCDRTGVERGVDWVGGSVVVGPDGFPLAGPAGAGEVVTLVARCDLAQARDKRVSARNDVLADRRPELYGPVAVPAR